MQYLRLKINVYIYIYIYISTVSGQIVLGGSQLVRVKLLGGPGEKSQKIFEIFIPEIATNASNFKN